MDALALLKPRVNILTLLGQPLPSILPQPGPLRESTTTSFSIITGPATTSQAVTTSPPVTITTTQAPTTTTTTTYSPPPTSQTTTTQPYTSSTSTNPYTSPSTTSFARPTSESSSTAVASPFYITSDTIAASSSTFVPGDTTSSTVYPFSAATSSSTPTASSSAAPETTSPSHAHHGMPSGLIAAAIIVPLVVLSTFAVLAIFLLRRKRRRYSRAFHQMEETNNYGPSEFRPGFAARHALSAYAADSAVRVRTATPFVLQEQSIPEATEHAAEPPPMTEPIQRYPPDQLHSPEQAYFTGLDGMSITDTESPFDDEPPPPYTGSMYRNFSRRNMVSSASTRSADVSSMHSVTEIEPVNIFADPEDTNAVGQRPKSTSSESAISAVSSMEERAGDGEASRRESGPGALSLTIPEAVVVAQVQSSLDRSWRM